MATVLETPAPPALPAGMIRIRHKDPYMAGERQGGPDGRTVAVFDHRREALVPDDSGFHLNPGIEVVGGEPRAFLIDRDGGTAVQAPAGPMMILKAPVEHVGSQMVTAPDGTVIRFNASGYGMAPDNAWGHGSPPPGYAYIEAATPEATAKWRVQAPITLKSLQDAADALVIDEAREEAEEDPYRALMLEMAGKEVVPTTPEMLQQILNPQIRYSNPTGNTTLPVPAGTVPSMPPQTTPSIALGVPARIAPPGGVSEGPDDLGLEDEYGEGEGDEDDEVQAQVAPPTAGSLLRPIAKAVSPRPNGRPKGSKDKRPRPPRGGKK